jgi:hypothetical protein
MSRMLIMSCFIILQGCQFQSVPHEAILGKWKSNAELTLRSVSKTKGLTNQSRSFLHDDFFGHLETEFKENESRTINRRENYDSGFEPYEVLEVSDKHVRIKAWSNFFQNYDERVLYLEGDCFYEIFRQFGFRQYFCR